MLGYMGRRAMILTYGVILKTPAFAILFVFFLSCVVNESSV